MPAATYLTTISADWILLILKLGIYILTLQVICATQKQRDLWVLTKEGEEIMSNGSYEARIYGAIDDKGNSQKSLMVGIPIFTWIRLDACIDRLIVSFRGLHLFNIYWYHWYLRISFLTLVSDLIKLCL